MKVWAIPVGQAVTATSFAMGKPPGRGKRMNADILLAED